MIEWGRRVRVALCQGRGEGLTWGESVTRILALEAAAIGSLQPSEVGEALQETQRALRRADPEAWAKLERGEALPSAQLEGLQASAEETLTRRRSP